MVSRFAIVSCASSALRELRTTKRAGPGHFQAKTQRFAKPTEGTGRFGRDSRLDAAFATCYTDAMKSNATFNLRLVCLLAIVGAAGLCVRAQSSTPSPAATPPP